MHCEKLGGGTRVSDVTNARKMVKEASIKSKVVKMPLGLSKTSYML